MRIGNAARPVRVRERRLREDGMALPRGECVGTVDLVHLVAHEAGHAVAVLEVGIRVDPVGRGIHHDQRVITRVREAGDRDPGHELLGAVHGWHPPLDRRRRALDGVDRRVLVTDDDSVRDARGRGLVAHLNFGRVGGEEGEVDAAVACALEPVPHLLRPVLVVPDGEDRLVVPQASRIRMRVDVGLVRDVVAHALDPAEELDLVDLIEAALAVWSIEGDLHGSGLAGDRVRPEAVEGVEALAGRAIAGVVVVRLVRVDALLVEEGRRTVVAHDEDRVVPEAGGVREETQIDAAQPIVRDGEAVASGPVAGDHAGRRIRRARRLRDPGQRRGQAKPAAPALVPAHAVYVEGEALRRVGGRVERDGVAGFRADR